MLSELAFIDWAALLIALVLLAVTAIAAYLSHSGSRGVAGSQDTPMHADYLQFSSRPPAHAANDLEPSFKTPPPPVLRRSLNHLTHKRSTPLDEDDVRSEEVILDLTSSNTASTSLPTPTAATTKETIAERAARLRETDKPASKRPVAEAEPIHKSIPERQETLHFAGARSKLSTGMESTPGFSARAPGFFDDPIGRHESRYWDGNGWTEHVKEGEERFTDPL